MNFPKLQNIKKLKSKSNWFMYPAKKLVAQNILQIIGRVQTNNWSSHTSQIALALLWHDSFYLGTGVTFWRVYVS